MTADRTRATADLADLFFNFMPLVIKQLNERLADLEMTNTDHWALRAIDGPMPMNELAHCMDFEPSYVTIVADRLENLGLIERQPHPTDRRVKNLVVTAKGERLKKTLPDIVWSGPNTFSGLTNAERVQLAKILTKLTASET